MRLMKLSGEQASGKTTLLREIELNSDAEASESFKDPRTLVPIVQFIQDHVNSPRILVLIDDCSPSILRSLQELRVPELVNDRLTVIVAMTEPVRSR